MNTWQTWRRAQLSGALRPVDLQNLLVDETLRLLDPGTPRQILRLPRPSCPEELEQFLLRHIGVRIPKAAVREGRSAPWDAFCNSYFAATPVAVWLGARGLAGKTYMLAALAWAEAVTLHANVTILGGSADQSEKVLEYLGDFWRQPSAPADALSSDPSLRRHNLVWGNKIRALAASQKQARGGHPERLRLDEADEMDYGLFQAVLGQPMSRGDIESQTTISSTHHYADGTMTKVLALAQEKGWPVYQWGYDETLEPNGWLTRRLLERKRQELTAETWRIEVEMGEPSIEGRAIDTARVEEMFEGQGAGLDLAENEEREFEPPRRGATYATGADWGKERDMSEFCTLRTDVRPMRLVAYRYLRRRPYPEMVAKLDERLSRYPGEACHDYTGVGHVGDFLEHGEVEDVTMVGKVRDDLFRDYILAVERREIKAPRVKRLYNQHKFVRTIDLFPQRSAEPGVKRGHPPDGFVAMAMAHKAASIPQMRLLFAKDEGQRAREATAAGISRAAAFLGARNGDGHEEAR